MKNKVIRKECNKCNAVIEFPESQIVNVCPICGYKLIKSEEIQKINH
jgi:predicted RNA-binding Zn-ribbon protein involved in translation (DUF1610 family)